MNDCPNEERIAALSFGDLDEAEASEIRAHIAACASCTALAAELCSLIGGLEELGAAHRELRAPDQVRSPGHRQLKARHRTRRPSIPMVGLALAAALLLAVLTRGPEELPATALTRPTVAVHAMPPLRAPRPSLELRGLPQRPTLEHLTIQMPRRPRADETSNFRLGTPPEHQLAAAVRRAPRRTS